MIKLLILIQIYWNAEPLAESYKIYIGNRTGKYQRVYKTRESHFDLDINSKAYIAVSSIAGSYESKKSKELIVDRVEKGKFRMCITREQVKNEKE